MTHLAWKVAAFLAMVAAGLTLTATAAPASHVPAGDYAQSINGSTYTILAYWSMSTVNIDACSINVVNHTDASRTVVVDYRQKNPSNTLIQRWTMNLGLHDSELVLINQVTKSHSSDPYFKITQTAPYVSGPWYMEPYGPVSPALVGTGYGYAQHPNCDQN